MPIDIKRTHYKTNGQGRSLQDIACYAKSGMMSYSLGTLPLLNKQSTGLFITRLRRAGLSSPFRRKIN